MKKLVLSVIALLAACSNPKVSELTCPDGDTLVSVQGQWQCKALVSGPTGATGPAALPTCSPGDLLLATDNGWVCQTNQCPMGYALSTASGDAAYTVCTKAISGSTAPDEMVKVGDFWIDRYEMSTCGNGSIGSAEASGTVDPGSWPDTSCGDLL